MFKRQTSGSVVCPSCDRLVSVNIEACPNCGRKNPGMWGYTPLLRRLGQDLGFSKLVIGGCIALYIIALVLQPQAIGNSAGMNFLSPSNTSLFLLGSTGAIPVFQFGRWWTVLSSGWLHGSLLHIAFNLLWIRQLLPIVTEMYGAARTVIIYTAATLMGGLLTSFAGQFFTGFWHGADLSVGASGAIFGLFGTAVAYGQVTGRTSVTKQFAQYAVIIFLIGFLMPNVDNWGHFGGLLGGYLVSRTKWLDPRFKERQYHLLIALGCLALVPLSIVASVLHGLILLP